MEGQLIQKFYSKRKHPNDMKYGKHPRRRPGFCFCGNQFCSEADTEKIPSSGLAGSWKKPKGLGLKEESENKRNLDIMINKEIQLRNEAED
jgi:hypothetical protein